jgi:hypothetical protein
MKILKITFQNEGLKSLDPYFVEDIETAHTLVQHIANMCGEDYKIKWRKEEIEVLRCAEIHLTFTRIYAKKFSKNDNDNK